MMTPLEGGHLYIETDDDPIPHTDPNDTSKLQELLDPTPLPETPTSDDKPQTNPARLWAIAGLIGGGIVLSALLANQPKLNQVSLPTIDPTTGEQETPKPICKSEAETQKTTGCIPLPELDPAELRRNELLAKTLIETSLQQTAIDRARRDILLDKFAPNHTDGDYTPLDIKLVRELSRQSKILRNLGQFEYSGEANIIDIPRVYNSDARAVVMAMMTRIGEKSLVQSFLAQQLAELTAELNETLAPNQGEITDSNRASFERISSEIDAINDAIRATTINTNYEPINLAYLASLMEELTLESANQLSRQEYMKLRMEARQQRISEEMQRQRELQEIQRIRQQSGISIPQRSPVGGDGNAD